MSDIEIKTRSVYDTLSPAEQKVAWYFLQNLSSVFDEPIATLAEKSGVSQVMWVRFCKSLGYSGLKDLKKNLFAQLHEKRAEAAAPSMDFLDTRVYASVQDIIGGVEAGAVQALRSAAQVQAAAALEQPAANLARASAVPPVSVSPAAVPSPDVPPPVSVPVDVSGVVVVVCAAPTYTTLSRLT